MTTELDIDQEVALVLGDVFERGAEPSQGDLDVIWQRDDRRAAWGIGRAAMKLAAEVRELDDYLAMIREEVTRSSEAKQRQLDWLEAQLQQVAERMLPAGSKHTDIVGVGRVQFRDYPESLRIADPEAFIAALGADEKARLVELQPKLLTTPAKAYAKEVLATGEILPGVERVEARRLASITYEGQR